MNEGVPAAAPASSRIAGKPVVRRGQQSRIGCANSRHLTNHIIAIVSVLGGSGSIERKLLWTLVILVLPVVGMILYFLIGRSSQDA